MPITREPSSILDDEVAAQFIQTKRDIDSKLDAIVNENVERIPLGDIVCAFGEHFECSRHRPPTPIPGLDHGLSDRNGNYAPS